MRLIVMFDLPTITKVDLRNYRRFIKFLTSQGYIRIQFSVYCKLCINMDSANTHKKRLEQNAPINGNIRYLVISENQYQGIVNINKTFNINDQLTTIDRSILFGGMNDEN